MADLICPGCAGPLPDCFCRSGSTAHTFASVDVTKILNWGGAAELARLMPSLRDRGRPPIKEVRVDSALPYTPEQREGEEPEKPVHAVQIERTLIISREFFDVLKVNAVESGTRRERT